LQSLLSTFTCGLSVHGNHHYPAQKSSIFTRPKPFKLSYASPAGQDWRWFASTDDLNRLEAFLRRSAKFGCRGNSTSTTFGSLCDEADKRLFNRVTYNTSHLLHPLLPPWCNRHYSFRQRTHDVKLPDRTSEHKN